MQGKKDYQEELFTNFQLSEFVPEENLYRKLKGVLDMDYLYAKTKSYYGSCGQKSIDPVVFFKLCLVGYLENIISDRQLMQHCSMRLDIRYFLNYKLTERLPWHSTMSRTRDLLPEVLFEEVFEDILRKCIDSGLVSGHTQVVDSAPVKANASMDSLELKVPAEELGDHLAKVRYQSKPDREKHAAKRKAKQNKATEELQTVTATNRELKEIKARNNKKKLYLTKPSQCKDCPFKAECCGKNPERRITITYYKDHYERIKEKLNTKRGRAIKAKRQSVVEPVFGILTQFMGMRKMYTKGIKNANKQMLMAAAAYNLKKLLKFAKTPPKSGSKSAKVGQPLASILKAIDRFVLSHIKRPNFCVIDQ
jgi:transposase